MTHQKGNVILIADYQIQEDHIALVSDFLKQVSEFSVQEPGCLQYTVCQSAEDPGRIVIYETYRDEAALEQHRQSQYFQEIILLKVIPLLESRTVSLFTSTT
ncbi:putative quinol monooxygenase [Chryseobacterium sp. OSA05B]|uniref:putative quinol monooxygenase n=1 Tax=Chryseobacterium sp. OSA05B TaxID=2862650 RepID=UPI001CBFA921|nr:antibiotic biosynthesis monooxygenase family protein [Chryseobacterium sp. OSA05B]